MGILLARENLSVIEQSLDSARAGLRLIKSRFKSGFSVKSDLLRAQVRISDLEQQRLQAESRIQVAVAYLNAAMGISVDTRINPVTPFGECLETKDNLNKWVTKALFSRPEIHQLQIFEEVAEKQVSIVRADHLPSLNVFGSYEIDSEDFDETENNYTVGAVVQMNLFSGFGTMAKIKKANASLKRMRELTKSMKFGIQVQTREAYLNAENSWKRIKVSESAVVQAGEALRIIKNRYKEGLLTIVNLLDAEVASQQSKTNYFKALHDYKVARIALELAAGTINTDFNLN